MPFWNSRPEPYAIVPPGKRIYAIGDVHGEAALLTALLGKIRDDSASRGAADTTLVILGDFIDRGDDAADLLLTLRGLDSPNVMILKGNHEATLVDAYRGDEEVLGFWLQFGGRSTLAGLGVPAEEILSGEAATILATLRSKLDAEVIEWLDRLPTSWTIGDYYFTHAGVRPGVDLERQSDQDLLWIRKPFLSSRRHHGKVIVHGHTIEVGEPKMGGNRIGIDTGAHEHGQLTAVGLEGDRQWLIQVASEQMAAPLP